jgi:hypothetical protein
MDSTASRPLAAIPMISISGSEWWSKSRSTANPVGWSSTSIARIFISLFDIAKPAIFVVQNIKPDKR